MVMPVPQPQILTNWLAEVKSMRDHAVALEHSAEQAVKDSTSLRKRFLANESVKDGMVALRNVESAEDIMREMLRFGLDIHAMKTKDALVDAFWDPRQAPVSIIFHYISCRCHR